MIVSKSLGFCRTLFRGLASRAFASSAADDSAVPPLDPLELAPPLDDGDAEEAPQGMRKRYDYSAETLRELGYDKYPYYVERAWWTRGNRMTFWSHWRTRRDITIRRLVAEWAPRRMRYKCMKTNNILPRVVIEEFQDRMDNMPRISHPNHIIQMCQFTSKRRGKLNKFRVGRHVFRQIADRGGLSGIQRATW